MLNFLFISNQVTTFVDYMARPKKVRRVMNIPTVSGFRPYGGMHTSQKKKPIFLLCEEYESLRLHDYKKFTHQEASEFMHISRPTFTRIYMTAREKIATAFAEGRQICIEGGKVQFDKEWYFCNTCDSLFNITIDFAQICPLCGNKNVSEYSNSDF